MRFLYGFQDRLSQFGEMLAQREMTFDYSNAYAFEQQFRAAVSRCVFCRNTAVCREWLSSDPATRGAPDFCPNARFTSRH
jgi:hypothetical protein